MFSATMTGQIQKIIYDNQKDGSDAMVKITMAVSKQYSKDPKTSKIFPLITIWGHDAAYLRKYAGVGQVISIINAEAEYYENDKYEDDNGNHPQTVSFKAGRVMFPKADVMKALVEAGVAEEAEGGDEDEDDDRSSRKKKRGKKDKDKKSKSRSERRKKKKDEDYDDYDDEEEEDEEEEEPPRRKKSSKKSSGKKSSKKRKKQEEEDDDYDDDNYDDDDDDNYFDDED